MSLDSNGCTLGAHSAATDDESLVRVSFYAQTMFLLFAIIVDCARRSETFLFVHFLWWENRLTVHWDEWNNVSLAPSQKEIKTNGKQWKERINDKRSQWKCRSNALQEPHHRAKRACKLPSDQQNNRETKTKRENGGRKNEIRRPS